MLPFLTGYFAWKRQLTRISTLRWLAVAFVAAGVLANVYPFAQDGFTESLTALHLPIALWLVVGIAYAWAAAGARSRAAWTSSRFSGELFIYYVLIALGGGVLTGFLVMMFATIGIDVEEFIGLWLAAGRSGRGGRGRLLAGGGQAERDREHGACADAPLHAPVRRRAGHVSGTPCC